VEPVWALSAKENRFSLEEDSLCLWVFEHDYVICLEYIATLPCRHAEEVAKAKAAGHAPDHH
jgi:hypothetical protein